MTKANIYDRIRDRAKPEAREKVKKQMAHETANAITRNVIRVVNMTPGAVAYRINNAAVYDEKAKAYRKGNIEKGLPDVIAIYKGRFIGVEVKSGKDRMSIYQEHRQQEIEQAGAVYFVARSTDDFLAMWENVRKTSENI